MLSRTEKQLKAATKERERHGLEAKAIIDTADGEDRDRTPEENAEIAEHQKAMDVCRKNIDELENELGIEQEIHDIGVQVGADEEAAEKAAKPHRVKSIGEQFVESDNYKRQKSSGFGGGNWNTGKLDIDTKATLLEGDNPFLAGGTVGTGGNLVPLDQRPGIAPILFQRLTVADLFASAATSSNAVNYIKETVATNASKVVPEGGAKPESALEFDNVQEPVKKIATFLPVSDEMLDDAPALAGYINNRLALFVRTQEEAQLLGGAGGSNFLGLMPRIPVANRFVVSDADTPNAADHIFAAITVARESFLEPDGVIINPDDWAELRLLKDDNLNYIGGSPFSNTGSNPGESIWGKRVVVTTAVAAGRAVVGAFGSAATVYRHGGLTVSASNSHSDYFVKNLTAIRAEERLALAVERPSAFAIADLGGAS